MELDEMTDEELDQHRRDVLREQERRRKLQEGLESIGSAICDYAAAARIAPPPGEHGAIGGEAIHALTGHTPPLPEEDQGSLSPVPHRW